MKIGVAGPVSLRLLSHLLDGNPALNDGYSFPFTSHLALELHRRDHEVVVFAVDPELSAPATHRGERLTVRVAPYRPRHRARDFFAVERSHLVSAMREEKCHVLHAQWSYEFALAALALDRAALITFHDWAPTILRFMPTPYRVMRLLMSAAVLMRAQNLTAVSPYLQTRIQRWRRIPVPVIPNAVELTDDPIERLPPGSDVVLGCVNVGFSKRKNVSTLLRAYALVREDHPNVSLRVAGDDHETGGPAHRWAREHGLDQGVIFDGRLSPGDLDDFYRSIDVFVHPSLEESQGMVLIEAMMRGVPVIGGESSGAVPWVLEGGSCGLLVDVRSPAAIAEAVHSLLNDETLWKTLSAKGAAMVRRRFDLKSVVDLYEQEYQAIANAR